MSTTKSPVASRTNAGAVVNQSYGYRELRARYTATLLKSLLLTFTPVAILSAWFYAYREPIKTTIENGGQLTPTRRIIEVPFQPIEDDQPVPKSPDDVRKNPRTDPGKQAGLTVIRDSVDLTANIQLPDSPAADTTGTGEPDTTPIPDNAKGNESGSPLGDKNIVRNEFEVTQNAEFEGGLRALQEFIRRQVRYPEVAREVGHQGVVHVRFVVDERGKVTDVTLLNHVGAGLDDEALRVVKIIPDFKKPARVGDQPVKVYFTIPISFRLR